MAIITCKECGKEISSDARACPNCGKRRTSPLTKLFAWFFVFVGVMTLWGITQGQKASEEKAIKENARIAALTPDQRTDEIAAKQLEKTISSARGACLIVLKQRLNDPSSADISIDSSRYFDKSKSKSGYPMVSVQLSGRAKNAFGAYILGAWDCVVVPDGGNSTVISLKQVRP
jgi:hypothetical protein